MAKTAPHSPDPDAAGVANDFLAAFLADCREGRDRTLADYQAQFPGHEAAVAAEWEALQRIGEPDKMPVIPQVQLDGVIGRGGQGTVYRGRQTYIDRPVAVKVLASAFAQPLFAGRFEREARTLAGLTHPHIVTCYHAGVTDTGLCYLVMEFVDGPNLRGWIDEHGPMPAAAALRLLRDLAQALQHAHERGIVHRDVKPENVLLQPCPDAPDAAFPWRAKLVDLGLARPLQLDARLTMATPAGAVLGTPATMAPEQFDAPEKVDHRADLYGLGCVLHHALTGRPAFRSDSMTDLMAAKTAAAGPDPRKVVPSVPAEVGALVVRLCARAPEDRPQGYGELVAELDRLLATTAAPRTGRRRAFAVAAVVVLGLGWLAWQGTTFGAADPAAPTGPDPAAAAKSPPPPGEAQAAGMAATLAPGQTLALFHAGDDPVGDWEEPGEGWFRDEATDGASVNSQGRTTATRTLPPGAFALQGRVDPRPRYLGPAEPAGRTEAAGLRFEVGNVALQIELRPAAGSGYRATALRMTRAGAAAPWQQAAALGECTGDFGQENPLRVAMRWTGGRLTCSFGTSPEVEVQPPDPAAPAALAMFVERGLVCFREFELRGL